MTPLGYLRKTRKQRFDNLLELLRFRSISALSDCSGDSISCAEWLVDHLGQVGFKGRLYRTKGNPIVYAEYITNSNLPTALYYGHYDVQPTEPHDLWVSPPFAPVIRGGYIYGRGTADDKGQVFAQIKGLEAVLKTNGALPINVKFVIEGEEEITPSSLPNFFEDHKDILQADVCVISDTAQFNKSTPAIVVGLRGNASAELIVYGPKRDLHSGAYGGSVANPIHVLSYLIAKMHDRKGRIAIPGFYQHVRPITKKERQQFAKLPFNSRHYATECGVPALEGESGCTTYERLWSRPALDVNGITGGHQGEGPKTIIPSRASAKISIRTVANQEPNDILDKLEKYLKRISPRSVRLELLKLGGAPAVTIPASSPWLEAAHRALRRGFGQEPVLMKEGASIPVVSDVKTILGLDSLLIGFCQNDDNSHSPNERLRVRDFENGCKTAAMLPEELSRIKGIMGRQL
ncbi:MAG: dipeptidase [Candidatus Zixiibacteriota bacterium]|nr:MAG: dipeptidase [candidate division Zixibacteria bacterium]